MDQEKEAKEQFRNIANELCTQFPELDLRFSFQEGSKTIRFMAAAVSADIHETVLESNPLDALHETIFAVKALAGLFDS